MTLKSRTTQPHRPQSPLLVLVLQMPTLAPQETRADMRRPRMQPGEITRSAAEAREAKLKACFSDDVPLREGSSCTVMHLLLALVAIKVRAGMADAPFTLVMIVI